MRKSLFLATLLLAACASSGPPTQPNDKEWNLLLADGQWIETLRKGQPGPASGATRKQQIETALQNLQKIEPAYIAYVDKVREYYERTNDPRASKLLSREKIVLGDQYMNVMSRYDRAIAFYESALQLDPSSTEARQRLEEAQKRRYVDMAAFAGLKNGMKEDDVRRLVGLPREDWIKQVVQNSRVYSVWIYPKADGGASAVYFDNGVVYHTNWNAAAPPAAAATK